VSDDTGARVAVVRTDLQFAVRASRPISAGDVVLVLHGEVRDRPSAGTLQVGVAEHVGVPGSISLHQELDEYAWRFLNHSCHPNIALRGRDLVALRAIEPWAEVTFDYNTTEYEVTRTFRCACDHGDCEGAEVAGFRHLTDDARERLRPLLSDHLLSWWDEQRRT